MITNETFDGLAFPVARVKYAGPTNHRGSRYIATIRRDSERTYRATMSYEDENGKRNHLAVALACLDKALEDNYAGVTTDDYVAIPGDLDRATYAFTFVPKYLLEP